MGILIGRPGADTIDGTERGDVILSGKGADTINGGAGNDLIVSGKGDDVVNGGSGSDVVLAGRGDDTVIHIASENAGALDVYSGGAGRDTLRLVVTQAVYDSAEFQADLAQFQGRIAQHGSASGYFGSLNLLIASFENIDVVIEGGGNHPPTVTTTNPAAVTEGDAGAPDQVTVVVADYVAITDPDSGDVPVLCVPKTSSGLIS